MSPFAFAKGRFFRGAKDDNEVNLLFYHAAVGGGWFLPALLVVWLVRLVELELLADFASDVSMVGCRCSLLGSTRHFDRVVKSSGLGVSCRQDSGRVKVRRLAALAERLGQGRQRWLDVAGTSVSVGMMDSE